jgi:hypothetical protein
MDDEELKEKWPELKARLLEKYPELSEEDLRYEIGKEVELQKRLQLKLKKNWKEIKNVLSLLG